MKLYEGDSAFKAVGGAGGRVQEAALLASEAAEKAEAADMERHRARGQRLISNLVGPVPPPQTPVRGGGTQYKGWRGHPAYRVTAPSVIGRSLKWLLNFGL